MCRGHFFLEHQISFGGATSNTCIGTVSCDTATTLYQAWRPLRGGALFGTVEECQSLRVFGPRKTTLIVHRGNLGGLGSEFFVPVRSLQPHSPGAFVSYVISPVQFLNLAEL